MDRESQSIALEKRHVHNVYDKIAPHFSDTRYKAWPRVKEFLLDLEPGCMVADVGCGNGKYLGINNQIYKVGCDCCVQLVDIARNRKHEVMVCDNIRLPYRDNCFDAVISIAVIHHFATTERRAHALRELARICRPGGQVMIYVWAMEQKQRKFDAQDVLVPWHLQPRFLKNKVKNKSERDLPSSGSTSDEDIKKPSSDKLFKSSSCPKGSSSGSVYSRFTPTTDHDISHGPACPRSSRGQIHGAGMYRIQSDSCCEEMSMVENSHFKQLLLPTRSDSVDEVFVNVTSDDLMNHSTSNHRTKIPPVYSTGQRSPKLSSESNDSKKNGRLQSPISMATNFIFDSLQGTKENISSAIDFSDSGSDEKSSLWDLLFGSPKIKRKGVVINETSQSNGVCNANSMQSVCTSNGATGNMPLSRLGIKTKRGAFTRTQSLDRDSTLCVIHKTQNRELTNGQLPYTTRHSTIFSNNQPVVSLNSMTAQGQLYRKSHKIPKSPLARMPQESSSVDGLSSSNESLSSIPMDSQSKNGHSRTNGAEKDNGFKDNGFAKCKPKAQTTPVSDHSDECVTPNADTSNLNDVQKAKLSVKSNSLPDKEECKDVKEKRESVESNGRKGSAVSQTSDNLAQHLRYYHVFREGELVDLIEKQVENLHIIQTYYDHANWCVVAEKVEVWRI